MNNEVKKYLVYGVFDLFHAGHVNLLYRASQLGEVYVVVFSDEDVLNSKGKLPVYPEKLRIQNIKSLDFVKDVILIGKENHKDIWKFAKENNIKYGLLGNDHSEKAKKWFISNGVELEITSRTEGISSTMINELLHSIKK